MKCRTEMQIQKSCLKVTDRVSNRVSNLAGYGRESEVLTVCDELRLNLEHPPPHFQEYFSAFFFIIHFYVYMQTYTHIKRMYLLVIWRGKKPKTNKTPTLEHLFNLLLPHTEHNSGLLHLLTKTSGQLFMLSK